MKDKVEKINLSPKWNPYPKIKPQTGGEYFVTYIDERGFGKTTRLFYDYGNLGPWRDAYTSFSLKVIAWATIPVFEFKPYDGDGFELDGN